MQTTSFGNTVTQSLTDADGVDSSADTVTGSWHQRAVDLSPFAGQQLAQVAIGVGPNTSGSAYLGITDLVLFSPANGESSGLVLAPGAAVTAVAGNNMPSGAWANSATPAPDGSTTAATHFFISDQVGTAQMEFAGGGWPIWRGEFTPFGSPVNNNITTNTEKFTGQTRDDETADSTGVGLDFFNARFYESTFGRFMSPDPSRLAYSDLTNPQSFNLYNYVLNNPLTNTDPSGMECVWDDGSYDAADDPDTGAVDSNGQHSNCGNQGGTWVPPANFEHSILTDGTTSNIEYGTASSEANSVFAASWIDNTPTSTQDAGPDSTPFSFPMTQAELIGTLEAAGITPSRDNNMGAFRLLFHNGYELRDSNSNCSLHVIIDPGSGENGRPVTGSSHYDSTNPFIPQPGLPQGIMDNGAYIQPLMAHGAGDVLLDIINKLDKGVTPTGASQLCN